MAGQDASGAVLPRSHRAVLLLHTSADFFTFTCNPLISLPFRLKSLKTCIDVSALVPVAGLSSHGGHVGIDFTEE